MEESSKIPKWVAYVAFPLSVYALTAAARDSIILIGVIQFLVGVIQLLIAFFKTIAQLANTNRINKSLKWYWLMTLGYFLTGFLLVCLFNQFNADQEFIVPVSLFYLSSSWGIALFHFLYIMFPNEGAPERRSPDETMTKPIR